MYSRCLTSVALLLILSIHQAAGTYKRGSTQNYAFLILLIQLSIMGRSMFGPLYVSKTFLDISTYMSRYLFWLTLCVVSACYEDVEEEESCQLRVASCKGADLQIEKGREIIYDRSLGALRAPTSRLRPFGPALGPSGLLDNVLHTLRALRPCDPRINAMMG